MKGYFIVKFIDYFGFEHTVWVWAYSKSHAISLAEEWFGYPMTVTEAYLDWDYKPRSTAFPISFC